MPVLSPDHLLEQADRLLATHGGARRQADLRRAISNAYYAVFHAILTEAADDFVGRSQRRTARYALVYRSVDHRSLRALCEIIRKQKLPPKYTKYQPTGGFGSDLIAVAAAVADLQEKRLLADYDPLFRTAASEAVSAIDTGRAAIGRFRKASRTRRTAFLSLLVFPPR